MTPTPLDEKLIRLHEALAGAKIPHAFGGALALAYYAEPRATLDIDVNVFRPATDWEQVLDALAPLGVKAHADPAPLLRDSQTRWLWDSTPVDLFFNNDPIHHAMADAIRKVPFAETRIPVLSPEHLLICKVAFDRPKDWIDIEQMIFLQPDLDRAEIERWIDRMLDVDDPRRARIDELFG